MPQFKRKKMCGECPFKATALKGWLGPHSIDDFEQMIAFDQNFICHTEVGELMDKGMAEEEIADKGNHCVGMLRYMNANMKLSRCVIKAKIQQELKEIGDDEVIEHHKFREHHERKP